MRIIGFSKTKFLNEELIRREEPCRICGTKEGHKIGETDYWDLQHSLLVYCPSCGLAQLDPMLTEESITAGCKAYYLDELARESVKEQERNLLRNYRRGIVFGYHLKRKGYIPREILEFGPGSGYFMAGMQFVFPGSRITVVDIVDEVLKKNREIHEFETLQGTPDDHGILMERKFDLVIARDILEHVRDFGKVIVNIVRLIKPGGLLHLLTPNGYEDLWAHYIHWKNYHEPSELLINHVNYFDGKGLKDFLQKYGFSPLAYYTYQLKTTVRGKGWKNTPSLEATTSVKRNAYGLISRSGSIIPERNFVKNMVLNRWYLKISMKQLTYFYCLLKHHGWIHLDPARNMGHEISGLFLHQTANS